MPHYYLTPLVWSTPLGRPAHWAAPAGLRLGVDLRPLAAQALRDGTPQGMAFCVGENRLADESGMTYLGADPARSMNNSQRNSWRSALSLAATPTGPTLRQVLYQTLTTLADPTGADVAPPLLPDRRGVLRLSLGGFEAAKQLSRADPEWPGIRDVLRRTYRATRGEVLSGQARPDLHRKMLSVWLEQFGLSPADHVEFIPTDLPDEEPLPHDTTITDDFNRADQSGLGTSSGGWSWTSLSSGIDIVSNQARLTTTDVSAAARADSDLSSTDHYCQAAVETSEENAGAEPGVLCRKDSSGTLTYYVGYIEFAGNVLYIYKVVSGTLTELVNTSETTSAGVSYTLKLQCDGSSIKLFLDGVEKLSTTDASITSGTRCGLDGFKESTGYLTWDNFEAADLAVTRAFKPWFDRGVVMMGLGRRNRC